MNISITKTTAPKIKPDFSNLGFGNYFTDHMFICDYTKGEGWHDARIVPYAPLNLDPSSMVFHYGQEVFEGLKAYKWSDGTINLFRPQKNIERLNLSNERICIPTIDEDMALEAIRKLIDTDSDWVPSLEGTSIYVRPFIIATEPALGVHQSKSFMFIVILSPVGAYYTEGINPVKIFVEDEYVRAVKGGTGFTKCGGNYGASIRAQMNAAEKGFTQVLWLDGVSRKYIEEVGTMNVFFKINGEIITPSLEGSVLGGITRASAIEILKDKGYKVNERKISIDEVVEADVNGTFEEMFGTGTAAVISPVGQLTYGEKTITINNGQIGTLTQSLYDDLVGIQTGTTKDAKEWIVKV